MSQNKRNVGERCSVAEHLRCCSMAEAMSADSAQARTR